MIDNKNEVSWRIKSQESIVDMTDEDEEVMVEGQ